MRLLKIGLRAFRNFVDLYLPMLAFMYLFSMFIIQIFFRYVLKLPLAWANETIAIAYIILVMLGAGYSKRRKEHIVFSLLYDALSRKGQLILTIVGNVGIAVAFALLVPPAVRYIQQSFATTPILLISYKITHFPFLVFLVMAVLNTLLELIGDVKELLLLCKTSSTGREESEPANEGRV